MKRLNSLRIKLSALCIGASLLAFGGSCITENFWMTQLDNTMSSIVDTVVGNTIITAVNTALGV